MSEQDARKMFRKLVVAMRYLHSIGVAHRDLKAENILLSSTESDEIGLIDFGLAFEWEEDMGSEMKEKSQNRIMGTSYYMAPEVMEKDYDERCDVWGLGVMLYIMTTASPPFQGSSDSEILLNVSKYRYITGGEFSELSMLLRHLIKSILVPKEQRPTLSQILQHPWLS